jgi:hypothetical protein
MVAAGVKGVCSYWGRVFGCDKISIPNMFVNYMVKVKFITQEFIYFKLQPLFQVICNFMWVHKTSYMSNH